MHKILDFYNQLTKGKFGQDVLWSVGSLFFLAIGGISVNLIIIAFLGENALGVFNQVYAVYAIFSQISVGGIQRSTLMYVSYNQNDRDICGEIATSAIFLVLVISVPTWIIGSVLAIPLGQLLDSPGFSQGLFFVLPGLLFFSINKVQLSVLNGLRAMRAHAILQALRFVLIPLVVAGIILAGFDAPYLSLTFPISEAVLMVISGIYLFAVHIPLKSFSAFRNHFRGHLSFGLRGFFSGVLLRLNTRIDVLILGLFASDALVGVYSFSAMLAEGFGEIPTALRQNVDPIIGKHFADHHPQQITDLARRLRRYMYPTMGVLGLVAMLLFPFVFRPFLALESLFPTWLIFAIIMLGVVINSGYKPFSGILLQSGRSGSYTIMILALVSFNTIFNFLLIPAFGVYAAAIVTLTTHVLEVILLVALSRRILHVAL